MLKVKIITIAILVMFGNSIISAANNVPDVITSSDKLTRDERIEIYRNYCEIIGEQYGISPELLEAIVFCESNYNPNATSKCDAQGLCQIIPKYQAERMQKLGIKDLYNPYQNILCCADILNELRSKYGDEVPLILGIYHKGAYSGVIDEFNNGIITRYAQKVMDKAEELTEEKENDNQGK